MAAPAHSGSHSTAAALSINLSFIIAMVLSFLDDVTSVSRRYGRALFKTVQRRKKRHFLRVGFNVFVLLSAVDALTAAFSRWPLLHCAICTLPLHDNVLLHGFFFVAHAVDTSKNDEAAAGAAALGAHSDKEQASITGFAPSPEAGAQPNGEAPAVIADKDRVGSTDKQKAPVGRHVSRAAGGRTQKPDYGLTEKFKNFGLVRSTSRMGRHPIKESCRAIQRWSSIEGNVGNPAYRRSDSRTKSNYCPKEPLVNLARDTSESFDTHHFFHLFGSNKVYSRIFTPQSAASGADTTNSAVEEEQKLSASLEDVLGLRKTHRDSTNRHHDMPSSTSLIRSRSSWNLPRRSRSSLTLSPSVLRDLNGFEVRNRLVNSKGAKEEDSDSSSSSTEEGVSVFDEVDHPNILPLPSPPSPVLPGSAPPQIHEVGETSGVEKHDEVDGAPLFNMRTTPRDDSVTGRVGIHRTGPPSGSFRDPPETIIHKFSEKLRNLLHENAPEVREYSTRNVQTPLKLDTSQCSAQHIKELKALVASKTSLLHPPAIKVLLEFCKGMLWQSAQLVVTLVVPKSGLKSIEDLLSKLGNMASIFEDVVNLTAPTWPSPPAGESVAARAVQKNAVHTLQSVSWMMNAVLLILHGHMVLEFHQRNGSDEFLDDVADVADRTSSSALIAAQAVLQMGEVCRSAFEMLDPEAQASVCDPANAGIQDAFSTENVEFVKRETFRFAKGLEQVQKTLKQLAEKAIEMYDAIVVDSSSSSASADASFS